MTWTWSLLCLQMTQSLSWLNTRHRSHWPLELELYHHAALSASALQWSSVDWEQIGYGTWSKLVQGMTCYPTVPSNYLSSEPMLTYHQCFCRVHMEGVSCKIFKKLVTYCSLGNVTPMSWVKVPPDSDLVWLLWYMYIVKGWGQSQPLPFTMYITGSYLGAWSAK